MFQIALCDDNPQELEWLTHAAQRWLSQRGSEVEGKIQAFSDARKLLQACREGGQFDVLLLDILMPELDGIELGRALGRLLPEAALIFITSSPDYALEAYGIKALRYLQKPAESQAVGEALDLAFRLHAALPRQMVMLHTKNAIRQVPMEDIVYIENKARNMTFVLRDGSGIVCSHRDCVFEDAVQSILSQRNSFVQPHKSYFVNMAFVRELQPEWVVMDSGSLIPITRRRLAEVRGAYLDYVSREDRV